ncbi:DUF2341 domain-containing protein [Planctomycetota bacterium]
MFKRSLFIILMALVPLLHTGCMVEYWGIDQLINLADPEEDEKKVVAANTPPVALVSTVGIANRTWDMTVPITFTIRDNEYDAAAITVEYSTAGAGGPWDPVTSLSSLDTAVSGNNLTGMVCTPDNQTFSFTWDASADVPPLNAGDANTGIYLRIIPNDGLAGGLGIADISDSLTIGNGLPIAAVADQVAVESGSVVITYELFDSTSDTCSTVIEYTRNGSTWYPATLIAGQLSNLASSDVGAGVLHDAVWNTLLDIGGVVEGTVQVRVTPSDGVGTGVPVSNAVFAVNNSTELPAIVINTVDRAKGSPATIYYRVFDISGDPVDVTVQCSIDGGAYAPAIAHPSSPPVTARNSSAAGVLHSFVWDFAAQGDFTLPQHNNVKIRMTPDDIVDGAGDPYESNAFTIGNEAPQLIITVPAASDDVSLNVVVAYTLTDSSSDLTDILVEFSIDDGATFNPATIVSGNVTGLASLPTGLDGTLTWSTMYDIGYNTDPDCRLRITPSDPDDGLTGTPFETGTFTVSNEGELPYVILFTIPRVDSSPHNVPFVLFDAASDSGAVNIEYSTDNKVSWHAVIQKAGLEIPLTGMATAPAPGGVPYSIEWDISSLLGDPDQPFAEAYFRIRVIDNDGTVGWILSNSFILGNTAPGVNLIDFSPTVDYGGDIFVELYTIDSESDPVDLLVEYSINGGISYTQIPPGDIVAGTTAGLSSIPGSGLYHSLAWDSVATLGAGNFSSCQLRVTPSDSEAGTATPMVSPFSIDNSGQLPWVTIPVISRQTDTSSIFIPYTLYDNSGDDVDIVAEFSTGGAFSGCTMGAGGDGDSALTASSDGEVYAFEWKWEDDLDNGLIHAPVYFRIIPSDIQGTGNPATTNSFVLGNTVPVLSMLTPPSPVSDLVVVQFNLSDSTSDDVNIAVQYEANQQIAAEGIGTGATGVTNFAGSFVNNDLAPGSVAIKVNAITTLLDDGQGNVRDNLNADCGDINYTAGTFDVTFPIEPGNGLPLTADYTFNNGTLVPATIVTQQSGLATSPGGLFHALVWDAKDDLGYGMFTTRIHVYPTDEFGLTGNTGVTGDVTVAHAPYVEFASIVHNDTEDTAGVITLTVQLSAITGQVVTVPFSVNGASTATGGGIDYTIDPSPLTIPAWTAGADITINITIDALDEDNETVIIDMGVPVNATAGTATTHTLTIDDDDPTPDIEFTAASSNGDESAAAVDLQVDLSAVSGRDIAVDYAVTGGTAFGSGTDYTLLGSGTLTIPKGALTGNISLTVNNDSLNENNETVIITLSSPANAVPGGNMSHIYTINNNDVEPDVYFTAASQASGAESGTLTATLELSALSGKPITVPYTVDGLSTALRNTDYILSPQTPDQVSIPAGILSADITINIQTDSAPEPDETVILNIGVPVNAGVGAPSQHTATITDDELDVAPPLVTGIIPDVLNDSNPGGVNISITFNEPMNTGVNPNQSITGLATAYTISGSTWTVGNTVWTGTIAFVDDNEEATGTFQISGFEDAATNTMVLDNSHTVTVDTVIPAGYTAAFDQPYVNNANKDAISFTFAAAEVGADYYYSIDDTNGVTPAVTGSGAIAAADETIAGIDLTALDDDSLTLTVYLTDPAGNQGGDSTDTVDKDIAVPAGYSVSYDPVAVNNGNKGAISFTFAGAELGADYNYSIDDTNGGTPAAAGSGTIVTAVDIIGGIDVTSLDDDTLTLTVYLTDPAGNQGADSIDTIAKDTVLPSGYSVSFDQSVVNDSNKAAISFSFAGAEIGTSYNYTIDDTNGGTLTVNGAGAIATGTDTVSGINLSGLDDETLTLTVYLTDTAGNQGADTTDTIDKDVAAPAAYTVSYVDTYVNNANKTAISFIFANAEVLADYDYSIDDTNGLTLPVTGSGTIATATDTIAGIDASSLDDDTLTLTVYLTDPAGNQGADTTDTITKDTVLPQVTGITPLVLGDVHVGSVNVSISFDEPMDILTNPDQNLAGLASSPYPISGSAWTVGNTVWTGTFTLIDDDESTTGTYQLAGFKDAAGNTMIGNIGNTVAVDTSAGPPNVSFRAWEFRKKITIQFGQVDADLTNFPVLVSLDNDADLLANVAQANGEDICFTAGDGRTRLQHEIEDYDAGSGTLAAWVLVPAVSSTVDTDIYIYYGNTECSDQQSPTGVWDANFVGVWHLDEEVIDEQTAGTHVDSSGSGNDGIQGRNDDMAGKISRSQTFDGDNDYVDLGTAEMVSNAWTLEFWVYPDSPVNLSRTFIQGNDVDGLRKYMVTTFDGQLEVTTNTVAGNTDPFAAIPAIPNLAWSHFAWTYDGTTHTLFRNGVPASAPVLYVGTGLGIQGENYLGCRQGHETPDGRNYLTGAMDEVRLSDTPRSAAWIAASFRNQDAPLTFYNVDIEESGEALNTWEEDEGTLTMTVTCVLSATTLVDVNTPFTVSGTALAPGDYTITASPVTITAGFLETDIVITLSADAVLESNETIVLTMGTPTNAFRGTTTEFTAIIVNDDAGGNLAGTISIEGTASEDGSPTSGAVIYVLGQPESTITLVDGSFFLAGLNTPPGGSIIVRAWIDGVGWVEQQVNGILDQDAITGLDLNVPSASPSFPIIPGDMSGGNAFTAWAVGGDSKVLPIENTGTGFLDWDISCNLTGISFSRLNGRLHSGMIEFIRVYVNETVTADELAGTITLTAPGAAGTAIPVDINWSTTLALNSYFDGTEDFETTVIEHTGASPSERTGSCTGSAGDLNGDGYEDFLLGSENAGLGNEGRLDIIYGSATRFVSGTTDDADVTIDGSGDESLGCCYVQGDFNGDGYSDIAVGAVNYNTDQGRIYVFYGHSLGDIDMAYSLAIDGELTTAFPGSMGVGDFNGDGFDDLAATAESPPSRAYVFYGGIPGITVDNAANADVIIDSVQGAMRMSAVTGAGDVNGDGRDELIIGASNYDAGSGGEGAAFIFRGSVAGLNAVDTDDANTTLTGDVADREFGISILALGDRDNDGYDDFAVGAAESGITAPESDGGIYIWHGRSANIPNENCAAPGVIAIDGWEDQSGDALYNSFAQYMFQAGDLDGDSYPEMFAASLDGAAFMARGSSAMALRPSAMFQEPGGTLPVGPGSGAGAGDFDGDGFDDLVVGDPDNDTAGSNCGLTSLRYGRQFGKGLQIKGPGGDKFADAISPAGDFNGDGFPDIIVGAHESEAMGGGWTKPGAAYIYYGTATGPGFTGTDASLTADVILYPFVIAAESLNDEDFGISVAGIGDWDGDTFDDVVIGAPGAFSGGTIYVFFGAPEGFAAAAKVAEIVGTVSGLGFDVAGGCDIDSNTYPDIVTGSTGAGKDAYVFLSTGDRTVGTGSSTSITMTGKEVYSVAMYPNASGNDYIILGGTEGGSSFATLYSYSGSLSEEGDFTVISNTMAENRNIAVIPNLGYDALPDVVIGAQGDGIGVYYGNASMAAFLVQDHLITDGGKFGFDVADAGDLNNDGFNDVLVGTEGDKKAFVFYGSATGTGAGTRAATVDLTITSADELGSVVCGGIDRNRDGAPDILMTGKDSFWFIPGRLGMTPGQND